MTERIPNPMGCRHCGIDRGEHVDWYTQTVGWHKWEQPTQKQILARMLARRSARTA